MNLLLAININHIQDENCIACIHCSLHCKNCINPELWLTDNSNELSIKHLLNQIESKEITFLGGEPIQQEDILPLIKALKKEELTLFYLLDMTKMNYAGIRKKQQIYVML